MSPTKEHQELASHLAAVIGSRLLDPLEILTAVPIILAIDGVL